MSITLEVYNEILYSSLRPWQVQYSDNKYSQSLNEIKAETYKFQPLYKIIFQTPVSLKRRYYHKIISNAAIQCLNELNNGIETAFSKEAKKYLVSKKFLESLKSKIADLRRIIELKQYFITNITPTNDDAYILQYLKYNLVRLYLEVQNEHFEYWAEESLTEQEILVNFFTDPPFDKDLIKPETEKLVPDRKIVNTPKSPKNFIPQNHEIRDDDQDHVLSYEEIVENPDKFGKIEAILFQDKYIDKDFVLTGTKGNIKKLAAIAQVLYHHKYFKKVAFHNSKRVDVLDTHVIDFFNRRYRTDIDQECRRFRDAEVLKQYINKNLWIGLLPSN